MTFAFVYGKNIRKIKSDEQNSKHLEFSERSRMVQGFIGRMPNQTGSCGFPPEVTVITDNISIQLIKSMSAGYPEFRWYRGIFRPKIYKKEVYFRAFFMHKDAERMWIL